MAAFSSPGLQSSLAPSVAIGACIAAIALGFNLAIVIMIVLLTVASRLVTSLGTAIREPISMRPAVAGRIHDPHPTRRRWIEGLGLEVSTIAAHPSTRETRAACALAIPYGDRFLKTTDSLRIVARPARRPTLFPQLLPIPKPGRHLDRQRESELMREHTHLPAMVGFVSKHVAQHFQANRPRPSPAVSEKLLDAAPTTAERFSEHLRAASRALGQSRASLLWRAVRAVELCWNLQMRSCKPDPLRADIVHVREDRRNGADFVFAGRFGSPGGRVKMLDKNLVHAIIGGKDPDRCSTELSVNLGKTIDDLTRRHGSLLPDL